MEIIKTVDGAAAMLSLSGKLDASSAPELFRAVEGLNGVTELALDLDGLEYVTSSGLREIVRAQRKMGGKGNLTLVNVPLSVADVFRLTGLYERFNIYEKN